MSIPAWLKRWYHRRGFQPGRSLFPRPFQPLLEELEARRLLATHMVSNTLDTGLGSLRQAILDADNDHDPTSAIVFNIPGTGQHVIQPASALPAVTRALSIDGTSEPNSAGTLTIVLDGAHAGDVDGLTLTAGQSSVKGLVIGHFRNGVVLDTNGGNLVEGNFIGTDSTGTQAMPNRQDGVMVTSSSAGNTIGGTDAGTGNIISGNESFGIRIAGGSRNVVQGNLIGLTVSGDAVLPNGQGVQINGGSGNTVGGADPGAGNVISGNNGGGLILLGSAGNLIQANLIGLDQAGGVMLGNGSLTNGIFVYGAAPNNRIVGNVIDADGYGVWIDGAQATGNQIQGNYIGTDVSGTVGLANRSQGVLLSAPDNTIGGPTLGQGNLISGCGADGIAVVGTSGALVEGNVIGTDVTGTVAIPNAFQGVAVSGSSGVRVLGNLISGNTGGGVLLTNATGAVIQGNFVGVDGSGLNPLGNAQAGVAVSGGHNNTIGAAGSGNVLAANASAGVLLTGGTFGNMIQGNYIGVGADGATALGNGQAGVLIYGSAQFNLIGGDMPGQDNVIAYTTDGPGVSSGVVSGVGPGNQIRENAIWGNADKGILLGGSGVPQVPVLTGAVINAQGLTVTGTYAGSPNTAYALEFFANDQPNASGYGEGQYYLGTLTVVTDNTGHGSFTAPFTTPVSEGQYVSATATTPVSTTSEFALDVVASGAPNTSRRPAVGDTAARALAMALPQLSHATAVLPSGTDRPAARPQHRSEVRTGTAGSGLRPVPAGRVATAPAGRSVERGIDQLFERWDELF